MELDITQFFNEACPRDYSASIAEIGNNAGADTWRAAMDDSEEYPLLDTEEKQSEFRTYIEGFGAWLGEEVSEMDSQTLNALCIQLIAGDIRECSLEKKTDAAWLAYEAQDSIGGRIYRGDDGAVYFYIGD